ncbi:MAG: LacI family DNA-binding transcriptional regulator [Candidatus Hydrogenedentota bacterium]
MRNLLNIYDIAERAGVSISTVSRVINNKDYVSKEKRAKILKILTKLNFKPNSIARSLVLKKHNTIGVFLHYSGLLYVELFASRVLSGISEYVKADSSYASQQKQIINLLLFFLNDDVVNEQNIDESLRSVDGILLFDIRYNYDFIKKLKKINIPFVLLNEKSVNKDDSFVSIDNFSGGYIAVKHLLDMGHKDICLVTGNLKLQSGKERFDGSIKALREKGIKIKESFIIDANYLPELARKGIKDIFKKKNRPTAIFAASDLMAMAIIDALKEMNISIPDEVSIVGFDNSIIAPALNPPLTSIDQPLFLMGYRSVEILSQLINTEEKKQAIQQILPVELIKRGSVKQY